MKTFTPTDTMINAAKAVFVSMATIETVKPIVMDIQRRLLDEGKYQYDQKWSERARGEGDYIIDPRQSYLMGDEDARRYFDLLNKEIKKSGFDVEDDYCPLLMAESALVDAKRNLIISMEPVITPLTGLTYEKILGSKDCMKNINDFVELTLKMLAPYVKGGIYDYCA